MCFRYTTPLSVEDEALLGLVLPFANPDWGFYMAEGRSQTCFEV